MHLRTSRKRAAEEADTDVPESKKLKLETNVSSDEPEEVQSATMSSAEPIMSAKDATIIEDEPATEHSQPTPSTHTSKPRVADSSFKEMPYTYLSPDDPALVTCM